VTRVLALVAVATVLVSACQLVGMAEPKGGPYPAACGDLGFSARRCAAIVARAQQEAELEPSSIARIAILPPTRDAGAALGGVMIARVQFSFTEGPDGTKDVWCKGVWAQDDLSCQENAQIELFTGIDHDVPCAGEAPNGDPAGCATLPPAPPPAAVAAAKPLRVAALDIPLDHVGTYEVKVGNAGLPNGYLSKRQFGITDTRPADFWITGGIRLDVRPPAGRPPVGSIYRDPFKGTEPVDVFVVFDVTQTSPGSVLKIRDLVVE
jgi:hypothetical protein